MNRARVVDVGTVLALTLMKYEREFVTPDLAAEWLKLLAKGHRHLEKSRVAAMARDIRANAWVLTHQSIAFDLDGLLIDGQHRLAAVILAEVGAWFMVARGVPAKVTDPIDLIRPRTLSYMTGMSNQMVATLSCLATLQSGDRRRIKRTKEDIESVYEANREAADAVIEFLTPRVVPASVAAAMAYTYPIGKNAVLSFAQQVKSGELLERTDPAFRLRAWLLAERKMDQLSITYTTLNALAAAIRGVPLSSLYTGDGGYRTITTRRRALRIPNTPDAQTVRPN